MALKFRCKNCGEDVVVRFLKAGEAAECKNCGVSNSVPESAESVDDAAAVLYQSRGRHSTTEDSIVDAETQKETQQTASSVPLLKPADSPKYQTFGQRFLAGIVDALVFLPLTPLYFYIYSPSRDYRLVIAYMILTFPLGWVYTIWMHGKYGQTLGKMALKVKVMDAVEQPITYRHALIREAIPLALSLITLTISIFDIIEIKKYDAMQQSQHFMWLNWVSVGWLLLEVTTMFTNGRRRAFHDYLAGTVVVNLKAA
ncbi:RDD family protein [Candidatus Poribacteria bacterium]|nr:RDD family protein [Candidatus Poribacteria bacterium]